MGHAGLDTAVYPGDEVLTRLWDETNLAWVAVYPKGPSHHDDSFRGKCARVRQIGLGLYPVFVGQEQDGPGSRILTAEQGVIDANAFADWMQAEDCFPAGSKGALDHEGVNPLIPCDAAYIAAFKPAFHARGYVFTGYAGHMIVPQVLSVVPGTPMWVVKVPPFNPSGNDFAGTTFPNGDPSGSGIADAYAWQCQEERRLTTFDGLPVDFNTCVQKDPSAP